MKVTAIRISLLLLFVSVTAYSQKQFTHQDTLRGTLNSERTWWDVLKYDITVQPDYHSKTIRGTSTIHFQVLKNERMMQIDFQEPMQIDSAIWNGTPLKFTREGN